MEEPFQSKRRRKSSFFRKSVGVSEFGDQTTSIASSEIGSTAFSFTNIDSTVSSGGSGISSRQLDILKSEAKQWKELLKELKTRYQLAKTDELSPVDWLRECPCLTEADKKYLKDMPDYKGIFTKYEKLKESMLIEKRTRALSDLVTKNFVSVLESKVSDQVDCLVKQLSAETLNMSDVLGSLVSESDDSGFVMDTFLSDSEFELDYRRLDSFDD